jgi:hypothetical protein
LTERKPIVDSTDYAKFVNGLEVRQLVEVKLRRLNTARLRF